MSDQFLKLHYVAIAIHGACFLYAVFHNLAYQATIPAQLRTVSFTNQSYHYFSEESEVQLQLPSVILLHGLVALVTVLFHSFVYLPIHREWGATVWEQGFLSVRWLEYSITCTLMSIASIMSAGTRDVLILVSCVFSGVSMQLIGCAIEQMKKQYRPLFLIGSLVNTSTSVYTIWYIASAPSGDSNQWIEFVAYTFYYALFPLNCFWDTYSADNKGDEYHFKRTDWIYNVLSLSSKVSLFWLQVGEVESKKQSTTWTDVQVYLLGILLPLVVLVVGVINSPVDAKETPKPAEVGALYYDLATRRFLKE